MSADEELKALLTGLAGSYGAELDVRQGIARLRADSYGFDDPQIPQEEAIASQAQVGQQRVHDDLSAAGQEDQFGHGRDKLVPGRVQAQAEMPGGDLAATQQETQLLPEELLLLRDRVEAELDQRRADAELEVSRAKFEAEKTRQLAELKAQQIEFDARRASAQARNRESQRSASLRSPLAWLSWLGGNPATALALITTVGSVLALSRSGLSIVALLLAGASVFIVSAYAAAIFWAVMRMTARKPPPGVEIALRLLLGSPAPEETPEQAGARAANAASSTDPEQPVTEPASSSHARPRWQTFSGENCTVLLTDIQAFGAHYRNDEDRFIIRRSLIDMTQAALGRVWDECTWEDRGDGVLIIVPPSIPTANVMEHLHAELPRRLARHNRLHSEALRIQLRVAVTVGPVVTHAEGISGQPIIAAARLVEAPILKQAIAGRNADLGVIASTFVYDTVIRRGDGQVDPANYQNIEVNVKETRVSAWMQLFDPTAGRSVSKSGVQDLARLPAGGRSPSQDQLVYGPDGPGPPHLTQARKASQA
jgi:hypothetical protein